MPETFTPQPQAPIVREQGYASQAMSGYLQQFDLVEAGRLLTNLRSAGALALAMSSGRLARQVALWRSGMGLQGSY